jgi:hypothetical protein
MARSKEMMESEKLTKLAGLLNINELYEKSITSRDANYYLKISSQF